MLNKLSIRLKLTIFSSAILIITVLTLGLLASFFANTGLFNTSDKFPVHSVLLTQDGTIEVQTVETIFYEARQEFTIILLISTITLLIAGTLIMFFITKRYLKPIETLSDEIKEINENNLQKRISTGKNKDELHSLATSFNNMINHLQISFETQKRFSQNAAHELKTPITTMITTIEVAKMTNNNDDPEINELLQILEDETNRLSVLVQGLLKLNTNNTLIYGDINVKEAILGILEVSKNDIEKKNITVTITGELKLFSDIDIFIHALRNIIENAIRYNKDYGSIDISLGESISIIDTGIGINKEAIDNIFTPFYCVDISRSKALGGHGLGLSIVKQCLERLDYTYSIESKLNEYSHFKITPNSNSIISYE